MKYAITPPNNCFVTQEIFRKNNWEVKCGILWAKSILYTTSVEFLKTYDPQIGISPFSINGFESYDTEYGESLIFFSENTPKSIQTKLSDIFYGGTVEFEDDYEIIFEKLGWKIIDETTIFWGDLNIKKLK